MSDQLRVQRCYQCFLLSLLCVVCLFLIACGHEHEHGHGHDHSHDTVPERYSDLTNPRDDADATAEGAALFMQHCATCHGADADGKGPTSEELDPKPTALNDSAALATMSDAYLFWRLTEGGAADGHQSAMPAYEDILSPDQRWAVITYLRTLR